MEAKIQSLTVALNLLLRTSTSIAKLHSFVQETLIARVAIQPFVTNIQTLPGWQVEIWERLWGSALLLCIYFLGLAITALFLDYLIGSPGHLSWVQVCIIGPLIGISVIFGSLRHNLECYCHRLQFMGELGASSGDGLFSSLSSCSCSCSDL